MATYYVQEPEDQLLRLVDPLTKGIIFCANREHLYIGKELDNEWIEKYIGNNCPLLNVIKERAYGSTISFTHDNYVDTRKVNSFVAMLIDYACLMHQHLVKAGKVMVHCKNGRSRSPCIILAFFLIRGLSREHAINWLERAFKQQRPCLNAKSAAFPNFPKFLNVTLHN